MRLVGEAHFLHGFPTLADDGRLNVVVEVPAGSLEKWEVDAESGVMEWEVVDGVPRVVQFLGYPGNYGMVPRTLHAREHGGDGDPLDVIVLGAAVPRGSVLAATPIGVLRMSDRGERDEKIVAVVPGSPFEEVRSLEELDARFPGARSILATWFASYKGPGKIVVDGFGDADEARAMVEASAADYLAVRANR